jgi:hypothetical protein
MSTGSKAIDSAAASRRGTALAASVLFCLVSSQFANAQSTLFPEPLVVSRVQLVFSVVSHHAHLSDRVEFFNSKGIPKGNSNYVVPFLVCDPIVTLYNPTNAAVTRSKVRVAINDPPVGFRFKKNADYVRPEFASGEFHGLARLHVATEKNLNARKSYTLLLREMTGTNFPGKPITLRPGEAKQFSPWVESDWTWGKETSGGYTPRAFHDWNIERDLTNRDGRTANPFGVEAVPGWTPVAGFQTEHLSYSTRPTATRYDFEIANFWDGGWMGIKLYDTFSVEARPLRVVNNPSLPDFSVDLLGGNIQDKTRDLRRSFPMDLDHLRLSDPQNPVVSRTFFAGEFLQQAGEKTPGGKIPFALLTMVAKTQALLGNRFYEKPPLPTEDLYEFDFRSLSDFSDSSRFFGPSDAPPFGLKVLKSARQADTFAIDLGTGPFPGSLKVMGTTSLENGFHEDLTSRSTFIPGPEYSGIGKVIIDVSGLGDRYFVRIEE